MENPIYHLRKNKRKWDIEDITLRLLAISASLLVVYMTILIIKAID